MKVYFNVGAKNELSGISVLNLSSEKVNLYISKYRGIKRNKIKASCNCFRNL